MTAPVRSSDGGGCDWAWGGFWDRFIHCREGKSVDMKKFILFCFSMMLLPGAWADLAGWESAISADNPRNWYRFDEASGTTLVDHGPGGLNGEYIGVGLAETGLFGPGQAAGFPGDATADDRVMFASNWADLNIAGDWTAEFILYKYGTGQGNAQALINGINTSVRLEQWNSLATYGDYRGGVTQYTVADYYLEGTVAPPDEWSHMVFVRSGGQTQIYLNGVLFGSMPNVVNLEMQSISRSGADKLRASLDEVVVYDRALSAAQIATHFLATGITSSVIAPTIQTQPQSQEIIVGTPGATATFTFSALGTLPLDIQWMKDGVDIPGATSETLVLTDITSEDVGAYSVSVSNAGGSVVSNDALLTIVAPPFEQGPNQTVLTGFPAEFSVTLPDGEGYTLVWRKDGTVIPGETGTSLLIPSAQAQNSGVYTLEITFGDVTVITNPSRLIVPATPANPYAQTILNNNPMYFWRLNEPVGAYEVLDELGTLYGSYFEEVQLGVQGAILGDDNTAAGFIGTLDSKADIWDTYDQPTEFSIEFWAMRTGGAGSTTSPLTNRDLNDTVDPPYRKGWTFYATDTNLWQFRIGDDSPDWVIIDGTPIVDGKWTHLVGTYNETAGEMAFYIDGALVGSVPADYAPIDMSYLIPTFRIGAGATESNDGSFYFIGNVDEVAFYDYPLTSEVVAAHYAAAFNPNIAPVISQDPISADILEGGSGELTVEVVSGTPPTYQWQKDGSNLPGATDPTLLLENADPASVGAYRVIVTNSAGSTTSAAATVRVLGPLETYEATVLRDAPVAYWRLDESSGTTAVDSVGNHDGTYMNGVELGQPGALAGNDAVNFAARFTQSLQTKMEVPWSAALNTPQYTMECWAMSTGGESHRSPMTNRGDGPQEGHIFYADPNHTWQYWSGSGSGWASVGAVPIVNGEWYHLVGTYDGSVKRFFVNGQEVGSAAGAIVPNDADFLRIGAGATENPVGDYFFEGFVDEAAVYDKALSPAAVLTHYLAARPPMSELPILDIQTDAGGVVLSWDGTAQLQSADTPSGPWTDVPGAASPYQAAADAAQMFWRLTTP